MVGHRYTEGDWFAVPLREGGYALGVIARASRGGALLGYFFGPRRAEPPRLEDVAGLTPQAAVLVAMFGHLGLRGGSWPLLGRDPGWNRASWPMPVFVRYEELTGRSLHVFYDDADPSRLLGERQVSPGPAEQGPQDAMLGAGAVELRLTALLT